MKKATKATQATNTSPLSAAELEVMREQVIQVAMVLTGELDSSLQWRALITERAAARYVEQMPALLAEVERLRQIVRAVADTNPTTLNGYDPPDEVCFYCEQDMREAHGPNCIWMRARALLIP